MFYMIDVSGSNALIQERTIQVILVAGELRIAAKLSEVSAGSEYPGQIPES